jgi:hypothetical protein
MADLSEAVPCHLMGSKSIVPLPPVTLRFSEEELTVLVLSSRLAKLSTRSFIEKCVQAVTHALYASEKASRVSFGSDLVADVKIRMDGGATNP